jgi:hypothetical protein
MPEINCAEIAELNCSAQNRVVHHGKAFAIARLLVHLRQPDPSQLTGQTRFYQKGLEPLMQSPCMVVSYKISPSPWVLVKVSFCRCSESQIRYSLTGSHWNSGDGLKLGLFANNSCSLISITPPCNPQAPIASFRCDKPRRPLCRTRRPCKKVGASS